MKKTWKITLIAAATVLVLVLAVALLVSPVAKHYLVKHSPELIGRQVTVDKLRFNLFTGRLHVTDLRIAGAEDSTTFFSFADLEVRMRLLPLLAHRIDVKRIALQSPDLKIYQRGSEFNFDDIVAKFRSDTTQVAPAEPAEAWEIGIYDISIAEGHIFYKDLLIGATWGLNDLNLQIPGVYFSREKTDVGVVLNFAEGGSLATDLAYRVETSDYDLGIRLTDFTLAGLLPYVQQSLDVNGVEGRLTADVHLQGNADHLLEMNAKGTATLAGFALRDRSDAAVLTADTLHIDLAEGKPQPMTLRFNRIYASGVQALAELHADGGNNLAALIKPSPADAAGQTPENGAADAPATTSSQEAVKLTVADLEIRRSGVTLRDLTLEKPFEYRVGDIRMKSRDFDPDKRNKLTIQARMQKTGTARLVWDGSLSDIGNQNITLLLSNLDLRDFTPYSEHFTAYPVTAGNLSFRSQNVIRNRYLDGTNHLDAFEPKVDKKRKDLKPEMNIPLKLGLYVLKDKKGHVQMDLPVKGSLDSPEFSYRKIVMKAIGNVLLKVVTAPFSFLGGHRDNLEYIDIDPLQYAFTSEQYASFDKLAQMLQEKPEMKIALTQRIACDRALARQAQNNLRMAYYNSRQPRDTTGRQPQLSMLDYEKIQALDFKSEAVNAFTDSLVRAAGQDPARMNAAGKALALFGETATTQLTGIVARRDSALMRYMTTTHALPAGAFRIQPADSATLRSYNGRDRYTIALEVDGETVEIAPETSPDGTDTIPMSENHEDIAQQIGTNPAPEPAPTEE